MATPQGVAPPGMEEAILKDFTNPTYNLITRLESWVHVVDMIDDYVDSHITIQKNITQGLEKARKAVADAPRFAFGAATPPPTADGAVPTEPAAPVTGIAESFEGLRTTTDGLINKSVETEQSLKTSVLPQLATLKGDIEKHIKGLKSTGVKASKDIEKARHVTQTSIEHLGHHVSSHAINTQKVDYKNDPYVAKRNVLKALEDQVSKENNLIDGLISVEKNLETLERHIVQVIQQAVALLNSTLSSYSTLKAEAYHSISETFNAVPHDLEWDKFINNPNSMVIPYDRPKRKLENIYFLNSDHASTKPVLEGILQRKEGRLVKSYSSNYYVLTPSRFLLQYSSQNHVADPTPEFAIYIPDAQVGEMSPRGSGKYKFTIQAKDRSSTIGIGHRTFQFKTNTYDELLAWHNAITGKAAPASSSTPTSPVVASPSSFSHSTPLASPVATKAPTMEAPAAAAAGSEAATYVESTVVDPVADGLAATKLT